MSTSVTLILYSVMMPFWAAAGGGVQESLMEVELTEVTLRFSGGLEGAINIVQEYI